MAITAIHWLSDEPERFDDVPGEWTGDADGATVTLADDESLTTETAVLTKGVHRLGPLDGAGLTVTFDGAVAQVADRDGRVIVRPRHPDSPNLRTYAGTPCYPADPSWVVAARFVPYAEPTDDRSARSSSTTTAPSTSWSPGATTTVSGSCSATRRPA